MNFVNSRVVGTAAEAKAAMLAAKEAPKAIAEEAEKQEEQSPTPVEPTVEAVPEEAPKAAPKQEMWFREIDLGDGSGVQRFEARTKDELLDKMAKAQEHATRKIKELSRKIKLGITQPDLAAQAEGGSPEEDAKLDELAKKEFGITRQELKQRAVQYEFLSNHPDYIANSKNAETLVTYLANRKWPMTARNLEIAFEELSEDGLLELRSAEPVKQAAPVVEEGIPQPTVRKRGSSGLKPSHSSSVEDEVTERGEPSVEELRKMPMDQLKRIAKAEQARQRQARR